MGLISVLSPSFQACVQIFIRLIKDWCTGPHDEKVFHLEY